MKVTFDSNTMTGPGVNGEKYNMSNDGERQMNFIRLCCDAAQEDLTEFFEQWGLMTPFFQVVVNNGVFSVRSGSPISCVVEQIHDYSILVQQHENYIILRFKIPNTDTYNEDSLSLEVDENGIIGEIAWSIAI